MAPVMEAQPFRCPQRVPQRETHPITMATVLIIKSDYETETLWPESRLSE
jgi:hypothetical protein